MVGSMIHGKKSKDWISSLLNSEFFGSCENHPDLRKNEKNMFCIDCNLCLCKQYCMDAHCLHRCLKICRYVYNDVVRLEDMQMYFDCSKIQTYITNGERAVHLNPRPHLKESRSSTKSKNGCSCEGCGKFLQELPNCFCSIACKFLIDSKKPNDQEDKEITFPVEKLEILPSKEECSPDKHTNQKESLVTKLSEDTHASKKPAVVNFRKRKRKGVPHRAPFF